MKVYRLKIITTMLTVLTLMLMVNVAQAQLTKKSNNRQIRAVKLKIVNNTGDMLKTKEVRAYSFKPDPFAPTINPGTNNHTLTVVGDKAGSSQIIFDSFDGLRHSQNGVRISVTVNGDREPTSSSSCVPLRGSRYSCACRSYAFDGIYYVTVIIDKKP